jgi:crossover junction endodeoxyribonuclease RusA
MEFEFLIPKRPVSAQTRKHNRLPAWKNYVRAEAAKVWKAEPATGVSLHLTLVYLCDTDPVDIDNIVKPIQDALIGVVYDDDVLITDVSAHRRRFSGLEVSPKYSDLLLQAILLGNECVYIKVQKAGLLEDYL